MSKLETKSKQVIQAKGIKENPLPLLDVAIKVTNLKKAQRLLSRLISDFIAGKIKNQDAKDLAYLVSIYVSVAKEVEMEDRIKKLEDIIK